MKKLLLFVLAISFMHASQAQNSEKDQSNDLSQAEISIQLEKKTNLRYSLILLEKEYLDALKRGVSSSQFKSSQSIVMIKSGLVRIEAVAKKDPVKLIGDLERQGASQIDSYNRIVNAWYPISEISQLAQMEELLFVKPVYNVPGDIGAATSEGDLALQAIVTRQTFCVDGTGIRVGVLSDSYTTAFPGGAAAGVASGDLPGVGNPNGFTTPVTVVTEGAGIDEGRAMIEIVHDLAPGAQIFFNTTNGGQATYATAITNLASVSNCDIIVDDVRYFEEPFYMDGIIAQACNTVFNNGVPYFASAGNYGQASYESVYRDTGGSFNAHDFDPSAARDTLQSITVNSGSSINLTLQWDDPWGSMTPNSADTDLDVWLYNSAGTLVASSTDFNVGGDPTEFFSYTAPGGGGTFTYRILITRFAGPAPSVLKWVIRNSNGLVINEYPPTTVNAQSTGYGHSNATGANAVGAAWWNSTPAYGTNPPVPEAFTSSGGVQIRYNTNGVAITPVTRNKPNFTAVDGTSNTFFGNGNNFFGTSAAAPHAAAVAALMLEANNSLTPTQIRNLLVGSSIEMLTPGFDFITGSGLIQADVAVGSAVGLNCNISGIGVLSGPTCVVGGKYSVTLRVSYASAPCNDVLWVNGQQFAATGANYQDVTLTGLIPDGNPVSVTAYFISAAGCNLTVNNLFTAPQAPVAQNSNASISCSGDPFSINLQNNITNNVLSDFTWTVNYNGLTNGNGAGSGDFINESLTNLTGGPATAVYTVYPTGESQGCEGNAFTVSVYVPPLLTSSAMATSDYNGFNVSCNGGSDGVAEVTATGGTAPYGYLWSNGATTKIASGLSAGNYTVEVTDAKGCTSSSAVTLTEPTPLTIDAGENQTVYFGYPPAECADISWSGEGGGVPPYTITWSDGGAQSHQVCPGNETTTYTVTITDANGCEETDDVTICVIDVRCGNKLDKVELCHVPEDNPLNTQTICVGLEAVATHLAHGDMLAACGTDHSCDDPTKKAPAAVEVTEAETNLLVYPNPFTEATTVQFSTQLEGRVVIKVYNTLGVLLTVLMDENAIPERVYTFDLDAESLTPGMNFLMMEQANGMIETQKIIRSK